MPLDRHAPDATPTPCLIVDEAKMARNVARLAARAAGLGVSLRPHLKTVKSVEAAYAVTGGRAAPITVSTLAEAERFHVAGFRDILYAVGIAPQKLARVRALRDRGCDLVVTLDGVDQALAAAEAGAPAMIEIDSDGHRGGLAPSDPALVRTGEILHREGLLRGVMTHAGESYGVVGADAHAAFAERERAAAVAAAEALRAAGLACPAVSVGSTPTAHAARDLTGVTELRAGVYVFFDLVMAGIGVCSREDIALSVLATVIGHQPDRGWIIVDAGWMAMSRDRGTAGQAVDHGYGVVCDEAGVELPGLHFATANQEHGVIVRRADPRGESPVPPVGARLRILPNHACATAAQHERYLVLPADGGPPKTWERFGGW